MSGFVALFDRTGKGVDVATGERLHATIDHRGPDGDGVWASDRVFLGHQQLATTPQSGADDQPLRDGELVVVGDTRLDNRPELATQLDLPGEPTALPDSSYLLEAYRAWGRDCVDHLIGAFAFVLWDGDRERLLCARDHCGVKPCYYYRDEAVFAVASETKALLEVPAVDRGVDDDKIGQFLITAFEDREATFYDALDRLPPAHASVVTATADRTWQYWALDPSRTCHLGSDRAYERRFRELFERAVSDRLRATGRVGSALSGGLDSSLITVTARDQMAEREPIYTFSNVFDDAPSSDEREFIEPVVDHDGIESEYVHLDDVGALVDRDRVFELFDQPPHNTLHFASWTLTERASEQETDILLRGGLGDSAIGYGLWLFPHALRTGRWHTLWRELQAMSDVTGAPPGHLFKRHALKPLLPDDLLRARRRRKGETVLAGARNSTLDEEFVNQVGLDETWRAYHDSGSLLAYSPREEQCDSIRAGNAVANFELNDLCSVAHGVEYRYPFTDPRLLEFTLAIPPSQQFKNGWTRSIARRAFGELLPEEIQWRPWKTYANEGFWNALAAEHDELERLVEAPGPVSAFVDETALKGAYERFQTDPNSRDARSLWRALSLRCWLETDRPVSDAR